MGTGKSSRFFEYVSKNDLTAIVVSSRITYTEFMCSKPGFYNYQNLNSRLIDYMTHPKVVIQYQSLKRIRDIATTEITGFKVKNIYNFFF